MIATALAMLLSAACGVYLARLLFAFIDRRARIRDRWSRVP